MSCWSSLHSKLWLSNAARRCETIELDDSAREVSRLGCEEYLLLVSFVTTRHGRQAISIKTTENQSQPVLRALSETSGHSSVPALCFCVVAASNSPSAYDSWGVSVGSAVPAAKPLIHLCFCRGAGFLHCFCRQPRQGQTTTRRMNDRQVAAASM